MGGTAKKPWLSCRGVIIIKVGQTTVPENQETNDERLRFNLNFDGDDIAESYKANIGKQ